MALPRLHRGSKSAHHPGLHHSRSKIKRQETISGQINQKNLFSQAGKGAPQGGHKAGFADPTGCGKNRDHRGTLLVIGFDWGRGFDRGLRGKEDRLQGVPAVEGRLLARSGRPRNFRFPAGIWGRFAAGRDGQTVPEPRGARRRNPNNGRFSVVPGRTALPCPEAWGSGLRPTACLSCRSPARKAR